MKRTGGRNSRLKMAEQAFGAASAEIPHGKEAGQFGYFIKWGMEPS